MRVSQRVALAHVFDHDVWQRADGFIMCGVLAGFGVDLFGYVTPFDMSTVCLLVGTLVVWKNGLRILEISRAMWAPTLSPGG